jgi:hypothetical protein
LVALELESCTDCPTLESIALPPSLEVIAQNCFARCPQLEKVEFAANCRRISIAPDAFNLCAKLTSICLPAAVHTLCRRWLNGSSIERVTFEPGSKLLRIEDGGFAHSSSLVSIVLPASLEVLASECFKGCYSLFEVRFESQSHLHALGAAAFSNCPLLKSICLPASLAVLHRGWLRGSSIEHISFEKGSELTQLLSDAVSGAGTLKSIALPPGVSVIDPLVFETAEIFSVFIEEGNTTFQFSGSLLINTTKNIIVRDFSFDAEVTIPASITRLGDLSFFGRSSLSIVRFEPNTVISAFGARAFGGCSQLHSIVIPRSLSLIGVRCFFHCTTLESLEFEPNSTLRVIDEEAFSDCSGLKSLCLPASVETIGRQCFGNYPFPCSSLQSLTVEANSKLRRLDVCALGGCIALKSFCIPASVDQIGKICFGRLPGCISLTSLTFEPESHLTRFGVAAFAGCVALKSICVPASVTALAPDCFGGAMSEEGCVLLEVVTFDLSSQLTEIEERAFGGCISLRSVTLPRSLKYIGTACFIGCRRLSRIEFPADSQLSGIADKVFIGCVALREICIPASLDRLHPDWTLQSNLQVITFLSGAGLGRIMAKISLDLTPEVRVPIGDTKYLPRTCWCIPIMGVVGYLRVVNGAFYRRGRCQILRTWLSRFKVVDTSGEAASGEPHGIGFGQCCDDLFA